MIESPISAGHPLRITSSTFLTIETRKNRAALTSEDQSYRTHFRGQQESFNFLCWPSRAVSLRLSPIKLRPACRFAAGSHLLSSSHHRQLENLNFLRFRLSPFDRRVAQIRSGPTSYVSTGGRQQTFLQFSVGVLRSEDRRLGPSFLRSPTRFQRAHTLPSDREASTDFFEVFCVACPSPQSRVFRAFLSEGALDSSGPHRRFESKERQPENLLSSDSHHPPFRVRWRVGTIRLSEVFYWSTRFLTISSLSL